MENTYWLNLKSEDLVSSIETILPTVNTPYIELNSILGIMNNHGSDSIIRIKEIQVNELINLTTTALTAMDLWRITALTGGDAITPIKHDSNATTLPSQVSIVKYPNTVTATGTYLRRLLSFTGLSPTSLLGLHGARGGSTFQQAFNLNHIFSSYDADAQAYVLREGEGIAIRTNLTAPQNYPLELILHIFDGTDTHCVSEVLNVQSATELFGMVNGAGSGVVLTVSRIELRPIRTVDAYRYFTIESFSDMYGGTVLAPNALDTANPAIDSLVEFRKNASVIQGNIDAMQGRNSKQGGDTAPFRRLVQPAFGKGVALANGALQIRPLSNKTFSIDKVNNTGEIVLREGQGIGLFQKFTFAGWGNYEFSILFTVEDNGGAAVGGEYSYVF